MVESNLEKMNGETSSKQTFNRIVPRSAPPALAKICLRCDGGNSDPFLGHFTAALIISRLVQYRRLGSLFENFSAGFQRSLAQHP